jgi:oxygen-independent coproporphyrinogen-3 oxidase
LSGIYIHIPFCKQACNYCNFHFSTNLERKADFLNALQKEISLQQDFISNAEIIDTIYFGGGTPSLLSASELSEILTTIHQHFKVNSSAEITLEANPDDVNPNTLKAWHSIGINRLSLGVQSLETDELKWMNRAHHAQQSLQSIDDILNSSINNFSIDLIFGSPLLTDAQLEKNIRLLAGKNIPHFSCYALTVEEKTALYHDIKKKQSPAINNEHQAKQFLLTMDCLSELGYEQYEISNYAKPGMRSQHNSSYWKGKAYFGFGPSAHAFDGKITRRWNVANNSLYIKNILAGNMVYEEEQLNQLQQINEYIMISLRTIEGLSLTQVEVKFGTEISRKLRHLIRPFEIQGKVMVNENNHLVLTRDGKLFADGISSAMFM